MFQINFSGSENVYELAMAYYDEGLDVVPLLRKTKNHLVFFKGWAQFKEQRPKREEVETWFKDRDDMSVALVCGQFIVVDADTPEAMGWVEKNIPQTPYKVRTGKGMHYYYNNPQNYTTFATKRLNETPIERHIDIRVFFFF